MKKLLLMLALSFYTLSATKVQAQDVFQDDIKVEEETDPKRMKMETLS